MNAAEFREWMEDCPIVAAVKDEAGLEKCLQSGARVVFVLFGTICSIAEIVRRVKAAGCLAMVHVDLISGLSGKEVAVDFIRENTEADGIITTRQPLVRRAKELHLLTVQRFFVLDSMALSTVEKSRAGCRPDFIEILPGVMPKIIRRICQTVPESVIAGGLISDKEDIVAALSAGAVAASTTNEEVWFL